MSVEEGVHFRSSLVLCKPLFVIHVTLSHWHTSYHLYSVYLPSTNMGFPFFSYHFHSLTTGLTTRWFVTQFTKQQFSCTLLYPYLHTPDCSLSSNFHNETCTCPAVLATAYPGLELSMTRDGILEDDCSSITLSLVFLYISFCSRYENIFCPTLLFLSWKTVQSTLARLTTISCLLG